MRRFSIQNAALDEHLAGTGGDSPCLLQAQPMRSFRNASSHIEVGIGDFADLIAARIAQLEQEENLLTKEEAQNRNELIRRAKAASGLPMSELIKKDDDALRMLIISPTGAPNPNLVEMASVAAPTTTANPLHVAALAKIREFSPLLADALEPLFLAPVEKPELDVNKVLELITDFYKRHEGDFRALARDEAKKITNVLVDVHVIQPNGQNGVVIKDAHHLTPWVMRHMVKREHFYLYGKPGGGKTHVISAAAEALGMQASFHSMHRAITLSEIKGFHDAQGRLVRTPFRERWEHGGVFCFEEMDYEGGETVLGPLNPALANGIFAFPDGLVPKHPDFICVGTGNTAGRGGSVLFPGRRPLDSATLERFRFREWDYDLALEEKLTLSASPRYGRAWLKFIRDVRSYVEANDVKLWASPRASIEGAKDLESGHEDSVADIADAVLFKGVSQDIIRPILANVPLPMFPARDKEAVQAAIAPALDAALDDLDEAKAPVRRTRKAVTA